MSDQNLAFPIPNSVLEPYIKAAVSTAIIGALGDGATLVERIVDETLKEKVSSNGTRSGSSYDDRFDLVSLLARKNIREIVKETINEFGEEMRPKIRLEVERQLRLKSPALSAAMVDGLITALVKEWSVSVTLSDQ